MSDFDKEAEREKLREKYERDEKKREATEQMSELLLQGATMTNAHCSECNDPIFRYDGQEFCPTCEKAVDRGTGESDDTENGGDDDAGGNEGGIQVTSPDDNTRVAFGANAAAGESGSGDGPDQEPEETQGDEAETTPMADESTVTPSRQPGTADDSAPTTPGQSRTPEGEARQEPQESQRGIREHRQEPRNDRGEPRNPQRERTRTVPGIEPERAADTTDSGVDTTVARESLIRTLTRFSQQAEATDDPQRAREYLAAAREAAETLSKLR